MYSIQDRLSLLQWRLTCENKELLSLLQTGISLSRAEKILASQTGRWRKQSPPSQSRRGDAA